MDTSSQKMTNSTSHSHFIKTTGGSRIHYTQHGNPSEKLLLLLHGLGGSVATFLPLLPHLPSKEYNIISVDFEGFGKTALSRKSLSVENYVQDLDELISSLQRSSTAEKADISSPITIIGHSLGSIVALHYAARNLANVAGLGLLGVGRSASHIAVAKQRMLGLAERVRNEGIQSAAILAMTSNFAIGEDDRDGRREHVRKEVAASNPKAYAMVCEAMVSAEHVDPDYASIVCPAVFLSGRGDVISPPAKAHAISGLMGGKTLVEIVRGGHQPILSDLDGTKDAMAELFRMMSSCCTSEQG